MIKERRPRGIVAPLQTSTELFIIGIGSCHNITSSISEQNICRRHSLSDEVRFAGVEILRFEGSQIITQRVMATMSLRATTKRVAQSSKIRAATKNPQNHAFSLRFIRDIRAIRGYSIAFGAAPDGLRRAAILRHLLANCGLGESVRCGDGRRRLRSRSPSRCLRPRLPPTGHGRNDRPAEKCESVRPDALRRPRTLRTS